jgi:hypothetical protein
VLQCQLVVHFQPGGLEPQWTILRMDHGYVETGL